MEDKINTKIMVSICVMSYNLEKYISEALDSILMQKVNFKYNIVVGDDYSTDRTRQILQGYVEKYPNVFKVILHPTNIGMLANFAATLKACEGKYIALLDGDDYWTESSKLQKQVDFLESNKDYSMVFHNIELHDETKQGIIVKPFNLEEKNREYTYDEIVKKWSVGTCSVLCINNEQYRYIEDNLWFPVQDLPFYLCCASAGKLYYMAETMSVYRRLLSGSMNTEKSRSIKIHLDFVVYLNKLYNDFNMYITKKSLNRTISSHYLWAAQKSRKIGNKADYIHYLSLAKAQDPEFVYDKEIGTPQLNTDREKDIIKKKYNLILKSIHNLSKVTSKIDFMRRVSKYKSLTKKNLRLRRNNNE